MQRNKKDTKPAFFQLVRANKRTDIQGIYIFGLSKYVAAFGKRVVHYFAAHLRDMHGEDFLVRAITEEVTLKLAQYDYDMAEHKVTSNDFDMQIDEDKNNGLESFAGVPNPLKTVMLNQDPMDLTEIGSQASKHAKAKFSKLGRRSEGKNA
eukprot:8245279-Ditylum_brightwellii.AAC.1